MKRNRRDKEIGRDGRAGVRRRCPGGSHRLDAQGRRGHRPGRRCQRAKPAAGLDQRRGRPHADRAGYSISRAELGHLVIDVPADQKVVNVFDANVRSWSVAPAGGGAADHRRVVRARQGLAAGDRRVGEVRRREGQGDRGRADGQGRRASAGSRACVVVQVADVCGPRPSSRRPVAGRCRRVARRAARAVGVLLSLRRRPLRVWRWRREGAAADHGRFAGRGHAAARAA